MKSIKFYDVPSRVKSPLKFMWWYAWNILKGKRMTIEINYFNN